MIEAVNTLEGQINNTNTLNGVLNKSVEYVEPVTQSKTIIPTKQQQIVEPDEDVFALSSVVVEPIGEEYIIPTGTLEIDSNGLYNVKDKEYANVSLDDVWEKYGYNESPIIINKMITSCEEIVNNWDVSNTSFHITDFENYTEIYLMPYIDTKNCEIISFQNATNLTQVPNLDYSNVRASNFSNMFRSCTNLITAPYIEEFKIGTYLTYIFYGCTALKNVPVYNIPAATSMTSMFQNCKSLTDESLDNILKTCITGVNVGTKTLYALGFRSSNYPTSKIQSLPSYNDFINAGWSIGY